MYSHTETCLLPGTTDLKHNSSALLQQLRGGGGDHRVLPLLAPSWGRRTC